MYCLNAYHIISHTNPTPLIQHLFGTRSMQQPIQATPALRISKLKHPIDLEKFPLLGETDEGQVE